MSLNRFVGLGIFALSSSVFVTLAACDDSATAPIQTNPGNSNTTSSSSSASSSSNNSSSSNSSSQGGGSNSNSSSSSSKGGNTSSSSSTTSSKGGNTSSSSSSSSSSSDTSSTTSTSTGTGECTASTNLIALAADSTDGSWIGGDPASTSDDPCGVQGAIYAYGDEKPSVTKPAVKSGTEYENPCAGGKCCISGATVLWPVTGSTKDYKASVWGGGLGISLGDPGEGGTKKAYAGSAKGFTIKLSGSKKSQVIRLGYTQTADDKAAPFKEVAALASTDLLFGDVSCPTWADTCVDPGSGNPFDIQVQVVGGDSEGAFEVCIDSITPLL